MQLWCSRSQSFQANRALAVGIIGTISTFSSLNMQDCRRVQANSNPVIVPVLDANLSVSSPMRCSIDTNRFGSG